MIEKDMAVEIFNALVLNQQPFDVIKAVNDIAAVYCNVQNTPLKMKIMAAALADRNVLLALLTTAQQNQLIDINNILYNKYCEFQRAGDRTLVTPILKQQFAIAREATRV